MDNNKNELHVYLSEQIIPDSKKEVLSIGLFETEKLLHNNAKEVHTIQTHVISNTWLLRGYRIFVYMLDGEKVELKYNGMDDKYPKIRVSQNLEKMVLSNCFGFATYDF